MHVLIIEPSCKENGWHKHSVSKEESCPMAFADSRDDFTVKLDIIWSPFGSIGLAPRTQIRAHIHGLQINTPMQCNPTESQTGREVDSGWQRRSAELADNSESTLEDIL